MYAEVQERSKVLDSLAILMKGLRSHSNEPLILSRFPWRRLRAHVCAHYQLGGARVRPVITASARPRTRMRIFYIQQLMLSNAVHFEIIEIFLRDGFKREIRLYFTIWWIQD